MLSTHCSPKKCDQLLEQLFLLLDEDHIYELIDRPLERASQSTLSNTATLQDPLQPLPLLQELGEYIQFLYAQGLRAPRELSLCQAENEALFLLDRFYQAQSGKGYEAAVLDATSDESEGPGYLRAFLLDVLKQEERRKYIRWVINSCIDHDDWERQVSLLASLVELYCDILPADIVGAPRGRYTDYFPQLLLMCVGACAEFRRMISRK